MADASSPRRTLRILPFVVALEILAGCDQGSTTTAPPPTAAPAPPPAAPVKGQSASNPGSSAGSDSTLQGTK
jgi:uncharacterized lipoprotein YajG